MKKPLSQIWDLESLFPGGSSSKPFHDYLEKNESDIHELSAQIKKLKTPENARDIQPLADVVTLLQSVAIRIRQAGAFIGCLTAQNQKDKQAILLGGRTKTISAQYASALTQFEQILMEIDGSTWQEILNDDRFKDIAFPLDEKRRLASDKLPPEQEALVNDLAVDGYHGWGELYNTTVSQMTIPFEEDGKVKDLSVGQAQNKLSDPNKAVRDEMSNRWEEAWSKNADFCADALNHLAGFRLSLYKHRGWEDLHKEPLDYNRMSQQTLNVMWETIDKNKDIFLTYFERKAKLLGVDKLSWNDVNAPIGSDSNKISYDDAADFIVEQFNKFSPKMADFTTHAFNQSWIEAEDRAGKRPGAFCTSLPDSKETRVFMTYSGTASNVSTLAHELGHAYHQHVMNDLPPLAQQYAMNVAETASTFAEMIVADASVKAASNEEERLALLEDKVQRSVAFYMNIHARFIFETNFYTERKKGLVGVDRLNELMVSAQKEAFKDSLKDYHPHFWASKLHFYLTRVPFYNFPYTFGYLFSAGIYARALEEGQGFEDKYIALLQDTASMPVEELASKHLGVDLTKPDFWQSAIDLSIEDVKEFLELTK
ncbi:M3 family oligoendopeptidase [Bacillus horti]|uniref:PepF/M3 family oligoendopeptidase n=1 Tax=Caldalkalibacillus horti TaxID=77523 RepID=A0ABT9VW41_9BACI|nr:M3 family oligoendopeptidase [Bacillus horti]MDQ0165208.1 pepF/M3 family oligoendopeptidase [Bacillus horti]